VLVTGSTGFLGSKIVETLMSSGFRVRAFVRKSSDIGALRNLGVEIFTGDIGDISSLSSAARGVDFIVHAAADTMGTFEGGAANTVQGTSNILELCKSYEVRKLLYISSCCVYDTAKFSRGYVVAEDAPLEHNPEARGAYSYAKFHAEKLVLQAMTENKYPIISLRPGTIYGPGGQLFTPIMGFSLFEKNFFIIGDGQSFLPLVYVDNAADAIRALLQEEGDRSGIYNLIDPYTLTKKQYIEMLLKKIYPRARFFYFPYSLLYTAVGGQEMLIRAVGGRPFLTRYRLEASQKEIVYSGSKIRRDLGWAPPVLLYDALGKTIEYEKENKANV